MAFLLPGDTLIGTKQMIEAGVVLSKRSPKSLLFPLLQDSKSLTISLAFLIEALVLHERVFVNFSDSIFEQMSSEIGLSSIKEVVHPTPVQDLISELENLGNPDTMQFVQGLERVNSEPSLLVDTDAVRVFNFAFPDLSTKKALPEAPSNTPTVDRVSSKKTGKSIKVSRRSAVQRHFMHYESKISLAVGISYSVVDRPDFVVGRYEDPKIHRLFGYKVYGDQTLIAVRDAAIAQAQELNSWTGKDYFTVEAPLVFNYVLEKAQTKGDILKVALEVRESREAEYFRKQCKLFDEALIKGDSQSISVMIQEVNEAIQQLRMKSGSQKLSIDISFPLSVTIATPDEL